MHRLESVPDIGERPADDDAHGVVHVRTLHLVFYVDGGLVYIFKHSSSFAAKYPDSTRSAHSVR